MASCRPKGGGVRICYRDVTKSGFPVNESEFSPVEYTGRSVSPLAKIEEEEPLGWRGKSTSPTAAFHSGATNGKSGAPCDFGDVTFTQLMAPLLALVSANGDWVREVTSFAQLDVHPGKFRDEQIHVATGMGGERFANLERSGSIRSESAGRQRRGRNFPRSGDR